MYQTAVKFLKKFMSDATIYKHGFNLSPMYRRTTARVIDVSKDLHYVKIKIPLSYKNKNYVGSIFGGSMFSATDPIYMVQLINILGSNYVVWDKSACIQFKRPASEAAYATFEFSKAEVEAIKQQVVQKNEISIQKNVSIISNEGSIFAEVEKIIYIANKQFYKEKKKKRTTS